MLQDCNHIVFYKLLYCLGIYSILSYSTGQAFINRESCKEVVTMESHFYNYSSVKNSDYYEWRYRVFIYLDFARSTNI